MNKFGTNKNGRAVVMMDGREWTSCELRAMAAEMASQDERHKTQLRPLTRDEWIERRNWWVSGKGSSTMFRIKGISVLKIHFGDGRELRFDAMLDSCEMSPDCIHWQPCGKLDRQGVNQEIDHE